MRSPMDWQQTQTTRRALWSAFRLLFDLAASYQHSSFKLAGVYQQWIDAHKLSRQALDAAVNDHNKARVSLTINDADPSEVYLIAGADHAISLPLRSGSEDPATNRRWSSGTASISDRTMSYVRPHVPPGFSASTSASAAG